MNAVRSDVTSQLLHEFQRTCELHPFKTRPITWLMNAIVAAILDGMLRGMEVHGLGRDGKSMAQLWLTQHPRWLPAPGIVRSITIPKSQANGDNAFWSFVLRQWKVVVPSQPRAGSDVMFAVFESLALALGPNNGDLIVLFIDEAQRLSNEQREYIASLDDLCRRNGIFLFIVLMHQDDASGPISQSAATEVNLPHFTGRYQRRDHLFTGFELADLTDVVAQNLDRTRERDDPACFTARFAPQRFREGFRLAPYMPALWDAIGKYRVANALTPEFRLPADTAMALASNVLALSGTDDFAGFTEDDFRQALEATGYLKLELCRFNRLPRGA